MEINSVQDAVEELFMNDFDHKQIEDILFQVWALGYDAGYEDNIDRL